MTEQGLTVKQKTVADLLEKQMPNIIKAMPNPIPHERMVRIVNILIRSNPKLLQCTPNSFVGAIMEAAALGLSIDKNMKQAYLVPFKKEVVLIPGYQGLIALLMRSGKYAKAEAQVVRENDYFSFEYGTSEHLTHRLAEKDRGEVTHAWAMITHLSGIQQFHVMNLEALDAIKNQSKARDFGPWKTHTEEMQRKCPLRNICKFVDVTPEVAAVIAKEDAFESGGDYIDADIGGVDIDPIEKPTAELKAKAEESKAAKDPKEWVDEGDPNG